MKKFITMLIAAVVLFGASQVQGSADYKAREKGWHKGTYFLFDIGMLNVDEDVNVVNNQTFGNDYLFGYGMTWGWNFIDWLAVELQMRYGTEKSGANREHAANISMNAKYSILLDLLTRNNKMRLLPYVKLGGGTFGAAVPDTSAGNDRLGVWGPTFVAGGGLEFLFFKNLYVGLDFTEYFAFLQDEFNSSGTKILQGGFDPQATFFGHVGVHF